MTCLKFDIDAKIALKSHFFYIQSTPPPRRAYDGGFGIGVIRIPHSNHTWQTPFPLAMWDLKGFWAFRYEKMSEKRILLLS